MFDNPIGNPNKINKPIPAPNPNPDNQMGAVEIKKFTEMLKKLDENEKIIVAFLAENRSKTGIPTDLILDFLQSNRELKTNFPEITLELVEHALAKIMIKESYIEGEKCFYLTETQKNIARSVIKYDQKKIAKIITEKLWNGLFGDEEV